MVDRCKKLSSLEIFVNLDISDESLVKDSLNIMNVVIGAKQSLISLEVDQNIQEWTPAAMTALGCLENRCP